MKRKCAGESSKWSLMGKLKGTVQAKRKCAVESILREWIIHAERSLMGKLKETVQRKESVQERVQSGPSWVS
jgi:hypothetical protein